MLIKNPRNSLILRHETPEKNSEKASSPSLWSWLQRPRSFVFDNGFLCVRDDSSNYQNIKQLEIRKCLCYTLGALLLRLTIYFNKIHAFIKTITAPQYMKNMLEFPYTPGIQDQLTIEETHILHHAFRILAAQENHLEKL